MAAKKTVKKTAKAVKKVAKKSMPAGPKKQNAKAASSAKIVKKTTVRTSEKAVVQPIKKTAKAFGKGKEKTSKNKGLVVFGIIAVAIIAFAMIGKIKQGPPTKIITANVLSRFAVEDTNVGALNSPRGLAADKDGNIYVADLGNNRVVKFDSRGKVADVFGKKGDKAGEFKEPSGVSVSEDNFLFVADAWNGRIQFLTTAGEYMGEIAATDGNFYSPRNIAVDKAGNIYVADTGNSCVKKFDRDAVLIKRWGEFGTGKDRFQETFGIWVDNENKVYVGDAGNRRVKIFTSDGKFIRDIRVKGWQSGIGWPMVGVDSKGIIYAVDVQNNMVWIYNQEGKYQGSWGNKPNKQLFSSPLGIAIDKDDHVYISNMNQGEIVKLEAYKSGK